MVLRGQAAGRQIARRGGQDTIRLCRAGDCQHGRFAGSEEGFVGSQMSISGVSLSLWSNIIFNYKDEFVEQIRFNSSPKHYC